MKLRKLTALIAAAALLLGGCAQEGALSDNLSDSQVSDSSYSSSEAQSSEQTDVSSENQSSDTSSSDSQESESSADNSENTSVTDTSSDAEITSAATSAPAPDSSKEDTTTKKETATKPASTSGSTPSAADFSAEWKLSSTWNDGGNYCGGYEVVITNNTGKSVESWTAEITVPSGFKLTSQWNGIFSVSGTKLTVKNESYNGSIANGGTASFGFNYSSPKEFNPSGSATKINGSAASSSSSSNNNSNNNNNNNNTPTTTKKPAATVPAAKPDPAGATPVSTHGQLSVKGSQLVDKNGKAYQLKGMSTHGLTWFPDFVNESAFKTLRDDWNTNVVRLAMYVDEFGNGQCYMQNKSGSLALMEKGIDICIDLDMYVIVDWHVLNPGDPSKYTNEAIEFFSYISKKYGNCPNIIYEIVNEPNGDVSWDGIIKPYAEKVIPVIRKNAPDSVIIVGTPTWSQDIDKALNNPLKSDNVMYALHFYAATHTDWLRQRVETCVNSGLPIFVSEFGCCDASGNGTNDFNQTTAWLNLLDKYGISYINWNLANKDESSSAFKTSASANGNWSTSDLSQAGAWIRKWFRGEQ